MFWNNTLKLLYLCYISSHYFKGYKYIKNQEENDVLFTSRPLLNSVQYICIVVYTLLV